MDTLYSSFNLGYNIYFLLKWGQLVSLVLAPLNLCSILMRSPLSACGKNPVLDQFLLDSCPGLLWVSQAFPLHTPRLFPACPLTTWKRISYYLDWYRPVGGGASIFLDNPCRGIATRVLAMFSVLFASDWSRRHSSLLCCSLAVPWPLQPSLLVSWTAFMPYWLLWVPQTPSMNWLSSVPLSFLPGSPPISLAVLPCSTPSCPFQKNWAISISLSPLFSDDLKWAFAKYSSL